MLLFIPELFGISIEAYLITIILGLPMFFFWRWLYRKLIVDIKKRTIAIWLSTIIITPIIYTCLIFLFFTILFYYPNRVFDKEDWFKNKEDRYQMSANIINSKMLLGKTKAEVITLLGDEKSDYGDGVWHYYLGFVPSLGNIDPDELDITFKDGKVITVGQHNS